MIVLISAAAEADLQSIGDHIAQDNPLRAFSFVEELLDRCYGLAEMPTAFPLVPRYEALGIRRRIHGNYLIFFRQEGERLIVLHVLHGAMDYSSILFPTEE
jgi:toxin ParE1/3/4